MNNFKSVQEFAKDSIATLEENFIARYKEFKNNHTDILEMCNLSYDELCKSLLSEFKNALESKDYIKFYNEDCSKINEHIEVFENIYDDKLIEDTIQTLYDHMYNHAYFRAVLVLQKKLGQKFKI